MDEGFVSHNPWVATPSDLALTPIKRFLVPSSDLGGTSNATPEIMDKGGGITAVVARLRKADLITKKIRENQLHEKISELHEEFSSERALLDEFTIIFQQLARDFNQFSECNLFEYTPKSFSTTASPHSTISVSDKQKLLNSINTVVSIASQMEPSISADALTGSYANVAVEQLKLSYLIARLHKCNDLLMKLKA
jgi:hypothetical protein